MHLSVPPSALAAQADMHYFSISLAGVCWEDILKYKQVGVYVPGDIGDVTFDLTIITETNA
jgi:type VI secretion system protein ImpJ